jgi:hypothetical protein
MSVFGELNELLNKIPVWKELLTLPARVKAIEDRLNLAGAPVVDDRPVCPFCRKGRLDLVDEKPHRLLGRVGVMEQTLKCDACSKTRTQQREP